MLRSNNTPTALLLWLKEYSSRGSLLLHKSVSSSKSAHRNNQSSRWRSSSASKASSSSTTTRKGRLCLGFLLRKHCAADVNGKLATGNFLKQYRHYTDTSKNSATGRNDDKHAKNPSSIVAQTAGNQNSNKEYDPTSTPPAKTFIPRKAPLALTPRAREFLKSLLSKAPSSVHGIMLRYQPSTLQGQMRMVFAFDFIKEHQKISVDDEEVSLELMSDGSPKPPNLSYGDGMKKLYVHSSAFMKVLGSTMDIVSEENGDFTPTFQDRDGNVLDPNA